MSSLFKDDRLQVIKAVAIKRTPNARPSSSKLYGASVGTKEMLIAKTFEREQEELGRLAMYAEGKISLDDAKELLV